MGITNIGYLIIPYRLIAQHPLLKCDTAKSKNIFVYVPKKMYFCKH